MPLKDSIPYCINHPAIKLRRNEGLSALSTFVDNPAGFSFDLSRGVPVVMYVCPECRYIEMYAAHLTAELPFTSDRGTLTSERAVPSRRPRRSVLSALNFERAVSAALERGAWPFMAAVVSSKLRVPDSGRTHEFDAVIQIGENTFIVEIKSATSPSVIHTTVHEAMDRAEAFSRMTIAQGRVARPMVIVPAEARWDELADAHGVPVLRFDQDLEQFVPPLPEPLLSLNAG